jgi:hypothetical protein
MFTMYHCDISETSQLYALHAVRRIQNCTYGNGNKFLTLISYTYTTSKKKEGWLDGHILCRLKHGTEVKIQGMIKWREDEGEDTSSYCMYTTSRNRQYWQLKEEALERTWYRSHLGRGYGPFARQTTTEWWNDTTAEPNCPLNNTPTTKRFQTKGLNLRLDKLYSLRQFGWTNGFW